MDKFGLNAVRFSISTTKNEVDILLIAIEIITN